MVRAIRSGLGERGAAVVEFALVAPLALALVSAIITYAGWFWAAHAVQQAANEAARATLAGLDSAERESIATRAATRAFDGAGAFNAQRLSVAVTEDSETVTVRVTYDMRGSAFAGLALVPQPGTLIRRRATVRLEQP